MQGTNAMSFGTVLVTGGNGIVGSHVVDALLADGSFSQVVATTHRQQQYLAGKASYRTCDISDSAQVTALLDDIKPQVVIHTVSPGPFAPPRTQHRVNYIATKQLLDICRQHASVRAFVFTSSVEAVVLRSGFNSKPETEEESILNDLKSGPSAYARTKGAADALVLSSNTGATQTNIVNTDGHFQGVLLTTSLRIGGLYGERDEKTMAQFLKLVNTMGARVQVGPNKAVQDWVYTGNVALAHVLAAKALLSISSSSSENEKDSKVDGEAFFITDGGPMKFWDFSHKVLVQGGDKKLKGPPPAKPIKIPFGVMLFFADLGEWTYKIFTLGHKSPKMARHHFDFMRKGCWVSIDKAKARLGYEPVCDTEEGIRRSVNWFLQQDGKANSDEKKH